MAILKRVRALAILAALLTGCAWLGDLAGGPGRFAFSHATHVVGEKMKCVSCHERFARSDDPGMPAPDTCAACHDESDAEAPPERRVASMFDGETFRAAHAARLDDEQSFSHKLHAKDPNSCGSCHTDIETNEAIDESIGVTMARCTECHAEREVANECTTCHTQIDEAWAPPSHAHAWRRRHGPAVRACTLETADDCSMCHAERTCVQCHRDEPPASHNAFFRSRAHGVLARMDRQSCATCHQPDSCERCHSEATPVSHTGSWGGSISRHCAGCHVPLEDNGCVVCHRAAPSHSLAAPKPAWHTPAMNCRQCHGLSEPLPHTDNGGDCNACHL